MITTTDKLPQGALFYLPQYPGNIYRNLLGGKAEFVQHRLGGHLKGRVIEFGVKRVVATDPHDVLPECPLCGSEPNLDHPDQLCNRCAYHNHVHPVEPCTLCGKPVTWNIGICDSCQSLLEEPTFDTTLL